MLHKLYFVNSYHHSIIGSYFSIIPFQGSTFQTFPFLDLEYFLFVFKMHPSVCLKNDKIGFYFSLGIEKDIMVILEFCPYGNLLSFMKDRRQLFKPIWSKQHVGIEKEFTTFDLCVAAYQIAKGLEFLASRKVRLRLYTNHLFVLTYCNIL